jgi:hypothetical protein
VRLGFFSRSFGNALLLAPSPLGSFGDDVRRYCAPRRPHFPKPSTAGLIHAHERSNARGADGKKPTAPFVLGRKTVNTLCIPSVKYIGKEANTNMKRRTYSLHYCNRCRMTTRHTETFENATCSRCGETKLMGRGPRDSREDSHRNMRNELDDSLLESGLN